jgi:hypothetical protein
MSKKEQSWIDGSFYPDTEIPQNLQSLESKIDFIARLSGAWDFGILPQLNTLSEVKKPEWKEAVDKCMMQTSHTYFLLREWHNLPRVEYLGVIPDYIASDPCLNEI